MGLIRTQIVFFVPVRDRVNQIVTFLTRTNTMFDQNDIEVLQERVNVIWASAASPEIILQGKDRVSLKTVSSDLPLDRCTLIILYNRYRGRRWKEGIIGLAEIAASISFSEEDIQHVIEIISKDEYLLSQMEDDITESITRLYDIDIVVEAEIPIPVSTYVSSLHYDIDVIYRRLRGMMNITGHMLSIKAIIGGMYFGLLKVFSEEDTKDRLYNLEEKSSPHHIERDKIQDYIEWYESKMKEVLTVPPEGKMPSRVTEIGFFEESFKKLDDIERQALEQETSASIIYRYIQIYPPQVKTERYTIHPPIDIDIIDLISSATTSRDMPLIALDIEGKKIIKKYNNYNPDPSWFIDIDTNTMKIYVRTSKTKEKYQLIRYYINDNYFLLESQSKLLPIDDIISILCAHLDVYWITRPETYSSTYTSISNRINIDRDVLAWLITNPPGEYATSGIDQYVFVKEESKPNSLKDKTNIHIQLGEDKMYLSTSQDKTTSGTLVPRPARRWIGFERDQPFFNISVNRTPNIQYTNLCLNIYRHVMAMYIKYYKSARFEIERMARPIPANPPLLMRLIEREPTLEEQYGSIDLELYKYTPSSIDPSDLPIPIDREDSQMWKREGYAVMHLPTTIVNYPSIDISTSEDIWIRTSRPGRFFLVRKSNGGYIPVLYTGRGFGIILNISESGEVSGEVQEISCTQRVLSEESSTFGKTSRFIGIPESLSLFLRPIAIQGTSTYRWGITPNILVNLNDITGMNKTPQDVATYAYLCKQENWTQEVSQIRDDILAQRIDPYRHFRALEQTFKLNIYYIQEDMIEPTLVKPPHASFYLHRRGNTAWGTVLFYIMKDEMTLIIRRDNRTKKIISIFKDTSLYLDRVMDESNIIRMISPKDNTDTILQYQSPPITLGEGWNIFEQVVDDYGKVRGVTYRNRRRIATMYIGFAPLISPIGDTIIPIGDAVTPSVSRGGLADIIHDIRWMSKDYLLIPEIRGRFELWKRMEKEARVLRAVTVLLYSYTNIDSDTFIDTMMEVKESVSYDISSITNTLPSIKKIDPWGYFQDVARGMVEDHKIIVPSADTRESLRLYIKAMHKVQWPTTFPQYVVYSWDIRSTESESVFLSQESALSTVMMESYPTETDQIIISPLAYVLRQGNDRYLIQMGRDMEHIYAIAYEWINNKRNIGYSSYTYTSEEDEPEIPEVESLIPRVESISYIMRDTHPFLIIPL